MSRSRVSRRSRVSSPGSRRRSTGSRPIRRVQITPPSSASESSSCGTKKLRQLGDVAKAEKDNPVEAAKEFKDTVDEYRAQIGMLDLKLAQSGLDVNLGGDRGANLFRPISPNYVAYRADGLAVLKAFYDGGNFEQVEPGIWAGKPKGGGDETFYVPEEKVPDVFKEQRPARPTEAQAEGAHSEADEARAEQAKLNQELHDVVMRNIKDGHLMVKVNRVIEGNGFAAALRANQSPTKPGPKPGKLTTIPETMGIGHGEDTFTKLAKKAPGQTDPLKVGQQATEYNGPGWAKQPSDFTASHGTYSPASVLADAAAMTQHASGTPILDASVIEVQTKRTTDWKLDSSVRLKVKMGNAEVFIYTDTSEILSGIGTPNELLCRPVCRRRRRQG